MKLKNILKKGLVAVLASLTIASSASAQIGGGGGIVSGGFFKLSSGALLPINSAYTLGNSSNRFAEIWGNVGNFTTLTVGGVASGDLNMQGNDILNVDQIKGNSDVVTIGTATGVNVAGEGALVVQSGIENFGFYVAKDDQPYLTGSGLDAGVLYSTADPNSNNLFIGTASGDATNSSTVVVSTLANSATDLGFFDGETEPGIALVRAAGDKYVDLRWNGTYFYFGSNGSATQYLFGPTLNTNQLIVANDAIFSLGTTSVFSFKRNTIFGDNDIRMSLNAEPLVIGNVASVNTDFGKGVATRPTLYLTSETAYSTATNEYINWYHDTVRSRYISGKGASSFGTGTPNTIASETGADVYVTDELEVDGILHADSQLKVLNAALWTGVGKSAGVQFSGTASTRGGVIYDTDEGMSLVAGDSDGNGNHVINFISGGNVLKDHDNDFFFDDPTVCWFSRTDPDSDNQQKTCLSQSPTDFSFSAYTGDFLFKSDEQKGQSTNVRTNTETVTFSASPGDASVSTTSLIPDGAFLVGLSTRVTTTATNCTSVDIGDGTDVDMFGAATAITQNTTTSNADATAQYGMSPAIGAKNVTITANGGNCFDGAWAITAHYIDVTAATSN